MTAPALSPPPKPRRRLRIALAAGGCLAAVAVAALILLRPGWLRPPPPPAADASPPSLHGRAVFRGGKLTLWWDSMPPAPEARTVPTGTDSNINPSDYVGPQKCQECHRRNYDLWWSHPHRRMNALADDTTVLGDFSGDQPLPYRGGRATFSRRGAAYVMALERGGVRRTYEVHQTIGSRFFPYYVGTEVEGPEPPGHPFTTKDHVLPFGYWLPQKEWVPVIHIGPEVPDDQRPDPFDPPDRDPYYAEYASSCNYCHTTFPLADLLSRRPVQMGTHAPVTLHWALGTYLNAAHPEKVQAVAADLGRAVPTFRPMLDWEAPRYAVTLGVSCEACHLGGREHVASGGKVPPRFFPESPLLATDAGDRPPDFGRTHDNVNWACGRCHTGPRPSFAAGMSTWNSVEYADAMRGSCYSKLRCTDCHNPHKAIGPQWTRTADEDDAVCLKCHDRYEPAAARQAHTHHPAGSEGARCLNCHMPRLNEGIEDVVRTHMIYSPTRADMIEANHPNACNLCHTDKPIDWTLTNLRAWYGARYDEKKIASAYPDRAKPVALGWLDRANPSVRLVAAEALTRAHDTQALPQLLEALDDPYLVNRQFAAKGLQEMLGVRLADYGYHITMARAERRRPLEELRARLLQPAPAGP